MNENLKKNINKPISITIKLIVNNSSKEEHIQGILIDVDNDILHIEQHIPFSHLFIKDAKTYSVKREVNVQSIINNGIVLF